jgi:hypothetical protein
MEEVSRSIGLGGKQMGPLRLASQMAEKNFPPREKAWHGLQYLFL